MDIKTATLLAQKIQRRHILYSAGIVLLLLVSCLSLLSLSPYKTGTHSQYFRGRVTSTVTTSPQGTGPEQTARVRLLDGPQKNRIVIISRSIAFGDAAAKRLPVGSEILLFRDRQQGGGYNFVSRWYVPGITTLFIILLVLVILIGGWRGITSVLGLSLSILIFAAFVIPRIVDGHNAFMTCIEGAALITLASVYIAHGLNKRTTVALAGSLLTLALIVGLTAFASYTTGTSEVINESNLGILYAPHAIDIGGLLTGGVVIGSLGSLFDITTGQAAVVDEIFAADRKQSLGKLFWKGMSVGREHIAALINTLALVYVGVSLPTIVTIIVLAQETNFHAPLLVNLNTEAIAEDVMRTLVASIGMLVAMPITTWLAAYVLPRWTPVVDEKVKQYLKGV